LTQNLDNQLEYCGKNYGTLEPKAKPPKNETPTQKKQRHTLARKAARKRLFKDKECDRWVEALTKVEKKVSSSTRVIHVFDREGDITEVFDSVRQLQYTGVLVRAAQDRSLEQDSERLWQKLEREHPRFEQEIDLPKTATRKPRQAKARGTILFSPTTYSLPFR